MRQLTRRLVQKTRTFSVEAEVIRGTVYHEQRQSALESPALEYAAHTTPHRGAGYCVCRF